MNMGGNNGPNPNANISMNVPGMGNMNVNGNSSMHANITNNIPKINN